MVSIVLFTAPAPHLVEGQMLLECLLRFHRCQHHMLLSTYDPRRTGKTVHSMVCNAVFMARVQPWWKDKCCLPSFCFHWDSELTSCSEQSLSVHQLYAWNETNVLALPTGAALIG